MHPQVRRLATPHNPVSQFLTVNLFLKIHTSYRFGSLWRRLTRTKVLGPVRNLRIIEHSILTYMSGQEDPERLRNFTDVKPQVDVIADLVSHVLGGWALGQAQPGLRWGVH